MKMKKILLVALSLMLLLAFGCSHDTNNSSVTNPNTNPFTPKGSVAGVLTDTVTSEPIAGAVVHIYDKYATTAADGSFVIKNVPANSPVEPLNAMASKGSTPDSDVGSDAYNVTIDMTKVNAARQKASASNALYPNFTYRWVTVKYSSLGESLITGENATNHDTPVNGFVANMDVHIAKLESTIKIQVVDCKTNLPVAGATVTLKSDDHTNNSATGNAGNPVAATQNPLTTGTDGFVIFTKVESMQDFFAVATTSNGMDGLLEVESLDRLSTRAYSTTDRTALCLSSDDTIKPWITGTTPPFGADINLSANNKVTVVFTFSEDIYGAHMFLADGVTPDPSYYAGRTTAATSVVNGIFQDIHVYYEGSKTDADVAIENLTWTDAKTLAVTFSALPASRYTVRLTRRDGDPTQCLTDMAFNNLLLPDNPTDAQRNYDVTFTTGGSVALSAPVVSVGLTAGATFTYISWPFIPNASDYKVCAKTISTDGTQLDEQCYKTAGINSSDLANAGITLDWTKGYKYDVTVVAMSNGGIESAPSNMVEIVNTELPAITSFTQVIVDTCLTNKFNWDAYPKALYYELQVDKYLDGTLYTTNIDPTHATADISEITFPFSGWFSDNGGDWMQGELAVSYVVKVRAVLIGGLKSAWSDEYLIAETGCDIAQESALPAPTGLARVYNSPLYRCDQYANATGYEWLVERYVGGVLSTTWHEDETSTVAQYAFPIDTWFIDKAAPGVGDGDFWEVGGNVYYTVKVRATFTDGTSTTFTKWSTPLEWSNPEKPAFTGLDITPSLLYGDHYILEVGTEKFGDVITAGIQNVHNPGVAVWLSNVDAAPADLLSKKGSSASLLISISFNIPMVKADVENVNNWHIGQTVKDNSAGIHTGKFFSNAQSPVIDTSRQFPIFYDESGNRALIYLKYTQNAGNIKACFDFGHNVFTFSGQSSSGLLMSGNPTKDQISPWSGGYVY